MAKYWLSFPEIHSPSPWLAFPKEARAQDNFQQTHCLIRRTSQLGSSLVKFDSLDRENVWKYVLACMAWHLKLIIFYWNSFPFHSINRILRENISFGEIWHHERGSMQLSKKWFVFSLCLCFCPFSGFPSLSLPPSLLTIIKWRLITLRLPANRTPALKWLLTGDRTQLAAGGVDTLLCMQGYKSIFWSWARVDKPARLSFSCSLNIDIDETSINRDIRDGNWLSKWG